MKLFQNKKILILLTVSLLIFSNHKSSAQTVLLDPPEVYLGASFGMNGSTILFSPRVLQDYTTFGYNGGLAFRYITENHFGLQIEANYSQRGWTEEGGGYSRQLNYVEMPFLTHYYLGDTHRFIINLGPKIGYLINEKVLKDDNLNPTAEQRIIPAHNKFDYGIALGFGYNLHTRKAGVFQWELRAYYGLADVFPNSKADYFSTSNFINASVNLGYYFQLSGKKK